MIQVEGLAQGLRRKSPFEGKIPIPESAVKTLCGYACHGETAGWPVSAGSFPRRTCS
ncbi:MAG: hypothetical protein FWD64_02400 [Acidobacteriaceae bacterium]|nr:hypothetical protein [Acidobacteriaceae bacterium]